MKLSFALLSTIVFCAILAPDACHAQMGDSNTYQNQSTNPNTYPGQSTIPNTYPGQRTNPNTYQGQTMIPNPYQGQTTVCSEDVPPTGMVIIKTGSSQICNGACRSRTLQPVTGAIMIICAHQAVPKGYLLDSVTSTPDCRCLGEEDNAYVIRRAEVTR